MKILLTGGAGYIGSHVVLSLLEKKHEVVVIDNLSTGSEKLLPKEVNFYKCNITDKKETEKILSSYKFDLLMHFAGFINVEESMLDPDKYFKNNTDNAISFFEQCFKFNLNNIIFSSTAAAYGNTENNKSITENVSLNPINPYGESKVKTEKYLIKNKHRFNSIILRYFNVAGSDKNLRTGLMSDKASHLIKIVSEVATGKRDKIFIYGNNYNTPDGTAIRDYIHVSDLADIHVEVGKYLLKNLESNLFNCGYGNGFSVLDVVNTTNSIYQNKIVYKFSDRREGDVEKLIADTSKLLKYIKWQPKYNDLKEIINSSIKWEEKINASNI